MALDVAPVDLQRGRLLRGSAVRDDDRLPRIKIAKLGNREVRPMCRRGLDWVLAIHDLPRRR
jgi:hypothetical protein